MRAAERAKARSLGLLHYYTGRACPRGHIGPRLTSTGACLPCGALKAKAYRDKGGVSPEQRMFNDAKQRARQKGLPFALVVTDIVIPERCPVFGVRLVRSIGVPPTDASPSLDRIVPELGYTPGNIEVISRRANTIKSDASLLELEAVCAWLGRKIAGRSSRHRDRQSA